MPASVVLLEEHCRERLGQPSSAKDQGRKAKDEELSRPMAATKEDLKPCTKKSPLRPSRPRHTHTGTGEDLRRMARFPDGRVYAFSQTSLGKRGRFAAAPHRACPGGGEVWKLKRRPCPRTPPPGLPRGSEGLGTAGAIPAPLFQPPGRLSRSGRPTRRRRRRKDVCGQWPNPGSTGTSSVGALGNEMGGHAF